MDAGVEAELVYCCNCTIYSVGFVLMVVITGAGWLGLHAEKSATVYNCPR